ncbi:MAG TPA: hypothetical protein VHQ90_02930 [Thermoanaerobaculia bacterium]|nr:hypothetical protein [Thermoanaerobaculia bacterium]
MMPEAMRRAGPRGLSFAVALATLSALAVASVGFGACTHTPQPVVHKNSRAEAERPAAAGTAAAGAPAGAAAAAAAPAAGAAAAEQGSKAGATATATVPAGTPAAAAIYGNAAAATAIDRNAAAVAPAKEVGPKEKDGTHVIVDSADPATDTRTLAEAGKAEKERRANAPRPKVVITNKTLKHYATGQLTVADSKKKKGEGAKETTAQRTANGGGGPPSATDAARDEWYWRHRVLEIRQHWRRAVDRVKELEESAADWRRRFYSQDDPYVRDGQIKPSWDRALDELRQSKAEVEANKRDLAAALEEGRMKGALPGWLREGIDLEPAEPKPVSPTESIEPPIVKEPPINLPPQT